jgi:hypothetical protein
MRRFALIAVAVATLAGCGGGDSTEGGDAGGGASDLAAWLPPATGYATADLSALKESLDVPARAEPTTASAIVDWTAGGWTGLYPSVRAGWRRARTARAR